MTCRKCGSENVSVQSESQLKKTHRHGAVYWLLIGWWLKPLLWLFLTLPMIIIAIFRPKNQKIVNKSVAVCQSCGNRWYV